MNLEKLTIYYEKGSVGTFSDDAKVEALFNPTQITHSKNLTWAPIYTIGASTNRPGFKLEYQSASPQTLTLELFFDTYSTAGGGDGFLGLLPSLSSPEPESVIPITNKIAELANLDTELHRPPVCKLCWGKSWKDGTLFTGVLQQASRTFLLFRKDGAPVRATMNCTFMEYPTDKDAANELHSPDVAKRYVVRPGDTLMSIAAAHYGDISQWRRIADANRVDNPRSLTPGQALAIPRIR